MATDPETDVCGDRNRRRMNPEERCSAIFDAALQVFAERGFGGASLNDVADRAGVTKGCLYHYFDSKEALLVALLRCRATEADFPTVKGTAATREEKIAALVRRLWEHFQRPGQLELTTLAITEFQKAPELARTLFDDVGCHKRRVMQELVRDAAQDAGLSDGEIAEIATVIPYLVMGAALGQRVFQGVDPATPGAEVVEKVVTRMLTRGI